MFNPIFENGCKQCGGYLVNNSDYYIVCSECGFVQEHDPFKSEVDEINHYNYALYKEQRIVSQRPYVPHNRMTYFWKKFRFLESRQKRFLEEKVISLFDDIVLPESFVESRKIIEKILRQNRLAKKYYRHVALILYHIKKKRFEFPQQFKIDSYQIYDEYQRKMLYDNKSNKKKFVPWDFAMRKICMMLSERKGLSYDPMVYIDFFKEFRLKKNIERNNTLWDSVRDVKLYLNK